MAASSSATEVTARRRSWRVVSSLKNRSTRFSQEAEVGVYGIGYRLALVVNIFSLAPL